jgi:hypothetical protein
MGSPQPFRNFSKHGCEILNHLEFFFLHMASP